MEIFLPPSEEEQSSLIRGLFSPADDSYRDYRPLLTQYDPTKVDYSTKLLKPSSAHWFGTDHNGRDIFTRIIHGMRLTLSVGFISVIIGAAFGVVLGIISGYYGGKWDALIMRITDVMLAFPGILLALAVVSVLGKICST